jgi:hypothetical protein
MEENPCRKLEQERDQAWSEWEAAQATLDEASLPPVTGQLGDETPVASGAFSLVEISERKTAIDSARDLLFVAMDKFDHAQLVLMECYERHGIPPERYAPLPPRKFVPDSD